ncbi:MAG: 16S rRNA (cytosine(1402)-N(4))-methyltransferase RsmH [Clostridiales bacterium]|nr:16S rRNA (cytosine(1402)-N(4))-methyltransferase RsmH [Clostridiales bacterium]
MSRDSEFAHMPVLFEECIRALNIKSDGIYVDCTAGGGGHSLGILKQLGQAGTLISLDKDDRALAECERLRKITTYPGKWILRKSDFSQIEEVLDDLEISKVDGVLADLGVSSHQIDTEQRGFSYGTDGPLDMRMDEKQCLSAAHVINDYEPERLIRILREYGEERYAGRIVGAIDAYRKTKRIETTGELSKIIAKAMPSRSKREDQHPARRTFQAIRIEVNNELQSVSTLLRVVPKRMNDRARFAVISFHSLEDRRVKEAFRTFESPCVCPREFPVCVCDRKPIGKSITRKPILAGTDEIRNNKRSKSAKLRVFERNEEEWADLL